MEKDFGEALRALRTEHNMTQQQLADALHVDRSTIAYWESGKRTPDIATVRLIADSFDIDVVELLSAPTSYEEKNIVIAVDDEKLILSGEKYDEVIAIGPLIMMKFVCQLTKKYGIKTVVSMNPIMIDGTGMCGGCRLTVGGETKFACVDGPDFDGHLVDFDEAMERGGMYKEFERHAYESTCSLLAKGDNQNA